MSHTVPTIGRRVWFFASETTCENFGLTRLETCTPFDAGVLYVHLDGTVNVQVTDHLGATAFFEYVELVQDVPTEETAKTKEYWCEWMPYQTKKHAEEASK